MNYLSIYNILIKRGQNTAAWNKGIPYPMKAETKIKISQTMKLKGINLGDQNPSKRPEVREKIRNTLKGRPLLESTKQKMKGRIPWNKGLKLKLPTDTTNQLAAA